MTATKRADGAASMTGAVMAGDVLVIATIGCDDQGRMRLIKSRSGEVRLVDRSQLALRVFTDALVAFLKKRKIDALTFVCSAAAGGHMAGVRNYKVEALIQLIVPEVNIVFSSAVSAFQSSGPEGIPGPDRERLTPLLARVQTRAMLAAVYHVRQAKILEAKAEKKRVAEERLLAKARDLQAQQLREERQQFAAARRDKGLRRALATENARAGGAASVIESELINMPTNTDVDPPHTDSAVEPPALSGRYIGDGMPLTMEELLLLMWEQE